MSFSFGSRFALGKNRGYGMNRNLFRILVLLGCLLNALLVKADEAASDPGALWHQIRAYTESGDRSFDRLMDAEAAYDRDRHTWASILTTLPGRSGTLS